ncbi:MAG: hypothetical protein E7221_00500 [Clostridiales bacterium]|nr:hypothetical protein [Clostridiales bacterium]
MSRMKKVWSVIVALIMALTIFAVPTFALEGDGTESEVAPAAELDGDQPAAVGEPSSNEEPSTGNEDPQNDSQDNGGEGTLEGTTENGDEGEFVVDVEAPAAVTGLTGTASITKNGVSTIAFKWNTVPDADGYAISRYSGKISNGQYLDQGEALSYNLTDYNGAALKQRTTYSLHVIAYVKLKEQPSADNEEEIRIAEEAGAIKINPSGEYVMPSKTAATASVKTKSVERVERTKYDKGYLYKYYDQNGVYRGTSYSMWNTIKNKKSKTKYLIALDTRRNNVVIYKGKKGNWKVYKHFVCSCGTDGHRTPRGNFKILSKKPKFQTGDKVGKKVVRAKYTCWYATRIKGAIFFHSTLYHLNSKSRHAARHVGKHYSHGCIRLEIKNAKWIYNNCKKGTAVISRKYGRDVSYGSSGFLFSYSY